MKLKLFQVREFRSVFDSGPIIIDDITCLVGKNESGKTALLKALYRLHPIVNDDPQFNVTDDYPRKEVNDYEHEVASNSRSHATPIEAQFELEDDDLKAITDVFGISSIPTRCFTFCKNYTNDNTHRFSLDEKAARTHLAESQNLPDTVRQQLRAANDWPAFAAAVAAAENTMEISQLRDLMGKIGEHNASRYAFNAIIKPRIPKFLYFDEYYQLTGHENIPALIQRRNGNTLQSSDHPLLGLINLARLKLEDLLNVKRTYRAHEHARGSWQSSDTPDSKILVPEQTPSDEIRCAGSEARRPGAYAQWTKYWGKGV